MNENDMEAPNALEVMSLSSIGRQIFYRAHRRDTGGALEPLMTIEELYEWSGTYENALTILEGTNDRYYLTVETR
jgi:hypothetical protein